MQAYLAQILLTLHLGYAEYKKLWSKILSQNYILQMQSNTTVANLDGTQVNSSTARSRNSHRTYDKDMFYVA